MYPDYQALKLINSWENMDNMYARGTNFMQEFSFVIKYKNWAANCVTDVLIVVQSYL